MSDIVERLRADPQRNFDEAAAEIERLRKLVDDAEDVMRRQRAERLEQKAEIERLRGLLREGIKYPGGEAPLWRKRVCEALGE